MISADFPDNSRWQYPVPGDLDLASRALRGQRYAMIIRRLTFRLFNLASTKISHHHYSL